MPCECIRCDGCGGSGFVWRSFSGEYLGKNRCDDLSEMETCEDCGGDGITDMCDECRDLWEKEHDQMFEEEEREIKRQQY